MGIDIDAIPVADVVVNDTPGTVIPCTSDDSRLAHELLTGMQPGDLLRVTGTLTQPPAAGKPLGPPWTFWRSWTPDSLRLLVTAAVRTCGTRSAESAHRPLAMSSSNGGSSST
ncbi:hypothetical protein C1N81_02200 (plasmid) [Streptomyces sp. SGAir0957]